MSRVLNLAFVVVVAVTSLALPTLAAPQTPDVIGPCLPSVSQSADTGGPGRVSVLTTSCAQADAADLAITIADAPDPVPPDSNLTYAITAQNLGPSAAADATLSDPLPAGTTFVSFSAPAGWTCSFPEIGSTGTLTCTIGSLPVISTTFTVVVHVAPGVPLGTVLHNTGTFNSTTADPSATNNSATADTTVGVPTPTPTPTSTPTPSPTPTGTLPTATVTLPATSTVTPTPTQFTIKVGKDDSDKSGKQSEQAQLQQDHSNAAGHDDYHTEGGVVEVGVRDGQAYAVIATRDGPVTVLLNCESGCPSIQVGNYVEIEGVKETEQLFTAEEISVTR